MNHEISLTAAVAMTARYRQHRESILDPLYQNQNILPLSETFDRAAIDALLAKTGCTALRIYYGMDEELKVHAILVGADETNQDILPPTTSKNDSEDDDDYIYEQSVRCPPTCPDPSPLNES